MMKCLSFDFGGTTIKYAVIEEDLSLKRYGILETETEDYEKFLQNLYGVIDENCTDIQGICISLPGSVDTNTGEIQGAGAIYCLENKPLKQDIEKRFGIPVTLENDANCAIIAEVCAGAAKGCSNVLFLVLGTGIGGAVMINGKLLKTENCFNGEFGYLILDYEKMLTWEMLNGSVISVVNEVHKNENYKELEGKEIFDLYQKDAYITEKLDRFFQMLACGCYSLQTIFDPEMIIIGGAISRRGDLIENINRFVDKVYEKRKIPEKPQIQVGKFLDTANLIGAYFNFMEQERGGCLEFTV